MSRTNTSAGTTRRSGPERGGTDPLKEATSGPYAPSAIPESPDTNLGNVSKSTAGVQIETEVSDSYRAATETANTQISFAANANDVEEVFNDDNA